MKTVLVIDMPDGTKIEEYRVTYVVYNLQGRKGVQGVGIPLKPLPKGHGRLIDADELKTLIPTIETEYKYVHRLIDEAPTIIEADTGETE